MIPLYKYISALRHVLGNFDFSELFVNVNFVIITQLVQILMGAILLVRGCSTNFRTALFCVGVANLVSSSFLFYFPFATNQPAIPELYLPSVVAFVVALIACVWSVCVGRLKAS